MTPTDVQNVLVKSRKRHQREVLLQILLPLVGGVVLIAVLMLLVIILPRALQVSLVADFTMTALIFCPLAVCLLPFSIGMMTLAVMSGRVHVAVRKPLRRVETYSLLMAQRASSIGDRISQASIRLNAQLTPVMNWLDQVFAGRKPAENANDEANHGDKSQ